MICRVWVILMVDIKKIFYFILALIILILIGLITTKHLNDVVFVNGEIKEKEVEEIKYMKTLIDNNTNIKIEYDLSDEIFDDDIIKIRNKNLVKSLEEKDVVKYFSLSLYDKNSNKKRIKNSLIKVTLYLNEDLNKYEDLRVVRINNKIEITNEEFDIERNKDSIIFYITMSSKYGIIGINKK